MGGGKMPTAPSPNSLLYILFKKSFLGGRGRNFLCPLLTPVDIFIYIKIISSQNIFLGKGAKMPSAPSLTPFDIFIHIKKNLGKKYF